MELHMVRWFNAMIVATGGSGAVMRLDHGGVDIIETMSDA